MKSLKSFITEAVFYCDHAIHEILIYMNNDRSIEKIVSNTAENISKYLKQNRDAMFEDLLKKYDQHLLDIIESVPFRAILSAADVKKAKCFVLQSLLHRVDDEYSIHPKDWDFDAYNINDLNW